MIASSTCNFLHADEIITLATKHNADTVQKQFLKEAEGIKKIEKVERSQTIDNELKTIHSFFILTNAGTLFEVSPNGQINWTMDNLSYFTFKNRTLKNIADALSIKSTEDALSIKNETIISSGYMLAIDNKNHLLVPRLTIKNSAYTKDLIKIEKICNTPIHLLDSLEFEHNTFAIIGSTWPNIHLVHVPINLNSLIITGKPYKQTGDNSANYSRITFLKNAYLLAVGNEQEKDPYIIYGQIEKEPSQLRKVKTDYCAVIIKKMAFKESITKQNIIYPMPFKAEYFKIDDELVEKKAYTSEQFTTQKELCRFHNIPVDGSHVPFLIDYKSDKDWAILAHTKNGCQLITNSKKSAHAIITFAKKINFEDIFAIEKSEEQTNFYSKKGRFYLTQNETTAQFANDSDNKTSIVAAAGASIDDENVYVIENTYEKHTFFGSLLNKIYGPTESTLKVIKRTDVDNKQKGKGKDAKKSNMLVSLDSPEKIPTITQKNVKTVDDFTKILEKEVDKNSVEKLVEATDQLLTLPEKIEQPADEFQPAVDPKLLFNMNKNNQIRTLLAKNKNSDVIKQDIASFAQTAILFAPAKLKKLASDFLALKKDYGTEIEKRYYQAFKNELDFLKALVKKRYWYFKQVELESLFTLNTNKVFKLLHKSTGYQLSGIGQNFNVDNIENTLTPDEMKIVSLISSFSQTHFINDGNYCTKKTDELASEHIFKGWVASQAGAHFNIINFCEWQDIIITVDQNTQENGYGNTRDGNNINTKIRKLWETFYNEKKALPSYQEIRKRKNKNPRYVKLMHQEKLVGYFDQILYKKRMQLILQPFLKVVETIGKKENKSIVLYSTNLNAYEHRYPDFMCEYENKTNQPLETICFELQKEIYRKYLQTHENTSIKAIYFAERKCKKDGQQPSQKTNELETISNTTIYKTNVPPAAKLFDQEDTIVISNVPSEGFVQVGNDFWMGQEHEFSMSAQRADHSFITTYQNPYINQQLLENMVFVDTEE
ncbi:DUF4804 domain-containing protein [bacterium]|nr:MAG: DUF4804 domain-containing protein [bacterium]